MRRLLFAPLLVLALPAPADACTRRAGLLPECGEVDLGTLPRNVRYVPDVCREGGNWRVFPGGGEADDLDAPPDRRRRAAIRLGYDAAVHLHTVGHLLPLPAGAVYELGTGTLRVADRADHDAPTGGALRGVLAAGGRNVLVFSTVEDASPVHLLVESWRADAPATRTVVRAEWVVHLPDTLTGVSRDRRIAQLSPEVWRAVQPLLPAAVAVDVVAGRIDLCGGPTPGFALFPEAQRGPGAGLFRYRWVDAAGNATAWSEPMGVPALGGASAPSLPDASRVE